MAKQTTNAAVEKDAENGSNEAVEQKNNAIKTAFFEILKQVKAALTQYPTEYHRTFVEISYESLGINLKHGFYAALIHVQLHEVEGRLKISFSRNLTIKQQVGNYLDGLLSRIVYNNTAEAATEVLIEDSVSCELYNLNDFREANGLISKGFKDGQKVTV